ncbi:TonB-dependent receptor [Pseudomaricurvus alkylphenolicus]|uniref:TonB-dependent receptor n=1 Tax=Pseudomaricurvus alkylphenolicus TaxID=1306991 RepID=UPI0014227B14|nr:TonB-dependent receptor [Pseudomaricurvus alkylphenolicus]NIB44705.1 TonB-dependent receptor [Pseudomaricurvus alkylphenolicus]
MIFLHRRLCAALVTVVAAQATPYSWADEGFAIEEIVVTAQRREQSLQDVPIAVSAFNQEFLKHAGVRSINDVVAYTPGLTGIDQGLSTPQYAIRGISSNSFGVGGEASVGVFVDDAYTGRITVAGLPFVDAARVEVLKGPQGTLFGRNTSAGAISVTSNRPAQELSLDISQQLGTRGHSRSTLTANAPLIDEVLAIRGSLVYEENDGFVENITRNNAPVNHRATAGKIALLYTPNDDLEVLLTYTLQDADTGGRPNEPDDASNLFAQYAEAIGVSVGSIDYFDDDVRHDVSDYEKTQADAVNFRLNWNLHEDVSLTSITTYQEYVNEVLLDIDGTPAPVLTYNGGEGFDENAESFGQELRLNGSSGDLTWMLGVSYFAENVSQQINFLMDETFWDLVIYEGLLSLDSALQALLPSPLCAQSGGSVLCGLASELATEAEGDYRSFALYTDISWALSERINVNAGLRYSRDKKEWQYASGVLEGNNLVQGYVDTLAEATGGTVDLDALAFGGQRTLVGDDTGLEVIPAEQNWTKLTPRLAIDYSLDNDTMIYASAARGYKSGGFDDSTSFNEEESWSYEFGLKSTLWDSRLQLNAALYYYDYENFQVQVVENAATTTVNIPEMRGRGVEIEMQIKPLINLELFASLAYTESEFERFLTEQGDLKGNAPPYSPETTASLVGRYRTELFDQVELILQADANYQSKQYFTIDNDPGRAQNGYTLFNARAALVDSQGLWEFALFARNLGDKEYLKLSNDPILPGENLIHRGDGRLAGAEVRFAF